MNSVGIETGISSFTEIALSLELNEELPCEMSDHEYDKEWHDTGPGMWYMYYVCPSCGSDKVVLVCMLARRTFWRLANASIIVCNECEVSATPNECFIREEMRSV